MKDPGYNKPLYILPFDHRGSFQNKLFGWSGTLTSEQTEEIQSAKRIVYGGFQTAIDRGVPEDKAGILVDEQFGNVILRHARSNGYITACPAEKSGQAEFDLEYGEDFAKHIESVRPTFCKVLVRYNPEGDPALNKRQANRLRRLSHYLHGSGISYFMFELLVPAEKRQLDSLSGDKVAYDLELRPKLMVTAIEELQDAGVEPDVWKVEGSDRRSDCENVVGAARREGRENVGCILLGRGEDDNKVHQWLATASSVPGFIGFAVGRTSFWDALVNWHAGKISRQQAVHDIAVLFCEFTEVFRGCVNAA